MPTLLAILIIVAILVLLELGWLLALKLIMHYTERREEARLYALQDEENQFPRSPE